MNPIRYAGAEPVFIGCGESLCLCPALAGEWLAANTEQRDGKCVNRHTGAHVKALLAVHVFGNMANMPGLVELCRKYGLVLIEDSTEALGTYYTEGPYRGKMAGTIGDIGVYSFNGNKIITTGAGGMVVSNHADWLERAKHLSTQAKADELQFVHDEVGYNYRLTNLQAALGLAQLEQLEGFIAHKNEMYDFYKERLDGKNGYRILPFRDGVRSNKWFYSLYLEDARHTRDGVIAALKAQNIQTRPVWRSSTSRRTTAATRPTALQWPKDFRAKIVNLPCSTNLTRGGCSARGGRAAGAGEKHGGRGQKRCAWTTFSSPRTFRCWMQCASWTKRAWACCSSRRRVCCAPLLRTAISAATS